MPHWPIPHKISPTRFDLSDMLGLMAALDNPHLKLPPVIHVAGTNGKGSTIAYLKAIFEAAGKKVHAYTSPHLIEFNERIVLAGEKIFDDHLFSVCERVRLASEKISADTTFFENTTAAAFLAFSEVSADILLIEAGLGGRLDATNVVNPILTIITPISYDHMNILGPTLPIIAGEKAGIIKSGVPCVVNAQIDEVMDVFLNHCEEVGSESIAYGYDFAVTNQENKMVIESIFGKRTYPLPALLGDHQILNAAAVIMACEKMNIDYEHICDGLRNVTWPGRLQKITFRDRDIWLDGAHNTGGAQVLALWIKENFSSPVSLILGMTKNRDALAFASFFKDIVDNIYCVRVRSEPSSYSAERLQELVLPLDINVIACDDVSDAMEKALSESIDVVVVGSLFLVADVLKLK